MTHYINGDLFIYNNGASVTSPDQLFRFVAWGPDTCEVALIAERWPDHPSIAQRFRGRWNFFKYVHEMRFNTLSLERTKNARLAAEVAE